MQPTFINLLKKILLISVFIFAAVIAHGQTRLPKTKEVPGFMPGMTVTRYLDPATKEYVNAREWRRRRDGKSPRRLNKAPRHRAHYQGELNTVYVFGTGTRAYNKVGAETVHGVRFNPYLFCGIGVGINYYYKTKDRHEYRYVGAKFIPVFVDFKYYFFNTKVSPYLKADLGYGIVSGGGKSGRLYASPSIGLKCSVGSNMAINFDIGYQAQVVSEGGGTDVLDGVVFRLGWSF